MDRRHRGLLWILLLACQAPVHVHAGDALSAPLDPAKLLGTEVHQSAPEQPSRSADGLAASSGRARLPALSKSDVVLIIDQSSVSLLSSGLDVDGDGVVGRTRSIVANFDPFFGPAKSWTTDPNTSDLGYRILRCRIEPRWPTCLLSMARPSVSSPWTTRLSPT